VGAWDLSGAFLVGSGNFWSWLDRSVYPSAVIFMRLRVMSDSCCVILSIRFEHCASGEIAGRGVVSWAIGLFRALLDV